MGNAPPTLYNLLKMNKFLFLALSLVMTFAFSSCEEEGHQHEHYHVDFTFMKPDVDMTTSGTDLHMHVVFNQPEGETIHNIKMVVTRMHDGMEVFSYEEHVHEESGNYEFHGDVTVETTMHSDFEFKAMSWGHGETEQEAVFMTKTVHVHP